MTIGKCKHGEFNLSEGCLQCVAERQERSALKENARTLLKGAEKAGKPLYGTRAIELAAETALVLRPGEDVEAIGYHTEAVRLLEYAEARVIATAEDIRPATDDLSAIAKLKKAMETKRREYLDPLKSQAEAIRETYSTLMDPIFRADRITRDKILAFNQEQERIRLEQEEINRLKMEAAQKEMKLHGELSEPVGLVEVTPEAPRVVRIDMGTTGQRANWTYEVFDFTLLPDAYKVADNSQLTAIAKRHHDQKPVPGVRFYNEPILAVKAR